MPERSRSRWNYIFILLFQPLSFNFKSDLKLFCLSIDNVIQISNAIHCAVALYLFQIMTSSLVKGTIEESRLSNCWAFAERAVTTDGRYMFPTELVQGRFRPTMETLSGQRFHSHLSQPASFFFFLPNVTNTSKNSHRLTCRAQLQLQTSIRQISSSLFFFFYVMLLFA